MKIKFFSNGCLGVEYECPGCKDTHHLPIKGRGEMPPGHEQMWTWNDSLLFASFRPSIMVDLEPKDGKREVLCHHFVRDGIAEFCGDCPPEFRGRQIPITMSYVVDQEAKKLPVGDWAVFIAGHGGANSVAEARRYLMCGAVRVNGIQVSKLNDNALGIGDVVSVGKFRKMIISQEHFE